MIKTSTVLEKLNPVFVQGDLPETLKGLTADSREVKPGCGFIAVKGLTVDGHSFISETLNKGAVLVITDSDHSAADVPCEIRVQDTRKIWGPSMLAAVGNPQEKLKIAGVTGTNGKTTVSTLVYQVLEKLGVKTGLMGTVSTITGAGTRDSRLTTGDPGQIAAALSEMEKNGCSHVTMEVSSHALDQFRTEGINFAAAAFTNLSHDHLDYHKTAEEYIRAKKRLFDNLDSEAVAIVNSDDPVSEVMIRDCKADVWRFGLKDGSLRILSQSAEDMLIEIDEVPVYSRLSGLFNAYNVAAAYLICRALGFSSGNTAAALAEAKGARGRMERILVDDEPDTRPVVYVDYAHTPDALENVLHTIAEMPGRGKVEVVFGCGGDRDKTKRPEMAQIAARHADVIYVTSDNPRTEDPETIIADILAGFDKSVLRNVNSISEREKAIKKAVLDASEDSIILIAGKGHETYQEINGVRYPMDDAQIARSALRKRKNAGKEAR